MSEHAGEIDCPQPGCVLAAGHKNTHVTEGPATFANPVKVTLTTDDNGGSDVRSEGARE